MANAMFGQSAMLVLSVFEVENVIVKRLIRVFFRVNPPK